MENAKIEKSKWDILNDFQTLCDVNFPIFEIFFRKWDIFEALSNIVE